MNLTPALLALALGAAVPIPPAGIPAELPDARAARLATIAQAIDDVADGDRAAAAAIFVIWGAESSFSRWVHEGRVKGDCHKGRCRATCLGQVHPWAPDWKELAGTDLAATKRCATRTLEAFRAGIGLCASGITKRELRVAMAFQKYATGRCGVPSRESMRRAKRWSVVERQLWVKDVR